jgi:N-acetylmuramoyl-L-alanine amidase
MKLDQSSSSYSKKNRKCFLGICLVCIGVLGIFVAPVEAGILEVHFSEQDVRYTLYTLYDGQAEYVHLNKVSQIFHLSEEIDPIDGRVVLRNNDKTASFFPEQVRVIAERRAYFLDIPPRKIEGVIMIPLQFLTDILPLIYDGDITWDPGRRILQVGIKDLEISDVYSSPYGEYTRIAVEMNRVVSYKVTEKLPSLLIFELPRSHFTLSQNPLQVDSRSVKHVKIVDSFGTTQIILKLGSDFDHYKITMKENPPCLLIDVYNKVETAVEPQEIEGPLQAPEGIREEDITQETGQTGLTTSKKFSLRTVVIDPGHGGSDRGIPLSPQTSETPEIFEKDITLKMAKMLATSLTQRLGVRVILTREGDDFIPAEERTTIANNNRADVFISLHVNNASSPVLSGFEVYVMDYGSFDLPEGYEAVSAQSQLLDYAQARYIESSTRLAQQILSSYDTRNTGSAGILRNAPLFTLKGATMPAVHIEIGYNSNSQDQTHILQEEYQQLLVAAITDGIAAFKKQEEQ